MLNEVFISPPAKHLSVSTRDISRTPATFINNADDQKCPKEEATFFLAVVLVGANHFFSISLFSNFSQTLLHSSKRTWILDSCSSSHLIFENHNFMIYAKEKRTTVRNGDGLGLNVQEESDVETFFSNSRHSKLAKIRNILLISNLNCSLLSVSSLVRNVFKANFDSSQASFYGDESRFPTTFLKDRFYVLDTPFKYFVDDSALGASLWLWKQRLRHLNVETIQKLTYEKVVLGLDMRSITSSLSLRYVLFSSALRRYLLHKVDE